MLPVIAPLDPARVGELLVLQRAAYATEAQLHDDPHLPALVQTLQELRDELTRSTALGATLGPRLVGSVRAVQRGSTWHIGRLVIAPDRQGCGTGTRLLRAIEDLAPAGVTVLALFTGERSADNVRLYERVGYTCERVEPGRTPLVHLTKPVPSLGA